MTSQPIIGLIDSSALVSMHKERYALDVFPGLWKDVETVANQKTLITVQKVKDELTSDLDDWIHNHLAIAEDLFPDKEAEIIQTASDIARQHRQWSQQPNSADPYLVAAAEVLKCPAISEEQPAGNMDELKRIKDEKGGYPKGFKIPNMCQIRKVKHLNLLQFFREQGWKY